MSYVRGALGALVISALVLGATAMTAAAAAPSNDLATGATTVAVPSSASVDTTEATTDVDDAQANQRCGAPATDASVWFALTGDGTSVVVDVSASDYSAGVIVGVGAPGNLSWIVCGPGAVQFVGDPGVTYYVLAFDDQLDGGGNGGLLNIAFEPVQAPTVDFTLSKFGQVDAQTGIAILTGTYTCTDASAIFISLSASQRVGRASVLGSGWFSGATCDGTSQTWSAEVYPQNGKFAGGKALTVAFSFACGQFQCANSYQEVTVQLRGGKK